MESPDDKSFLREVSTQHVLPPLDGMPMSLKEALTPCHFPSGKPHDWCCQNQFKYRNLTQETSFLEKISYQENSGGGVKGFSAISVLGYY